jgi:hypothetical protein
MSRFKGFVKACVVAVFAASAGTLLGVLIAPAPGAETRQRLSTLMHHRKEQVLSTVARSQDAVQHAFTYVRDHVKTGKDKIADMVGS